MNYSNLAALIFGIITALAPLTFAQSPEQTSEQEIAEYTGIFGEDDRKMAYDNDIDKAVVRLNLSGGGSCTAFLISSQWALTAGHCVKDSSSFAIGLDTGKEFTGHISVTHTWTSKNYGVISDDVNDWILINEDFAILRLSSPVPNAKTLEIASPNEVVIGASAMSIGYPKHTYETAYRVKDTNCRVRNLYGDAILTDCAMSRGNSGGPLLIKTPSGKWKVAGIASTQFVKDDGSMIVGERYTDRTANRYTNASYYTARFAATIFAHNQDNLRSLKAKSTYSAICLSAFTAKSWSPINNKAYDACKKIENAEQLTCFRKLFAKGSFKNQNLTDCLAIQPPPPPAAPSPTPVPTPAP